MRKVVDLSRSPLASYSFTIKPKPLEWLERPALLAIFLYLVHRTFVHLRTFVHTLLPLYIVLSALHVPFYLVGFLLQISAQGAYSQKCLNYNITIFFAASSTFCHITLKISWCSLHCWLVYDLSPALRMLLFELDSNSPLSPQYLDQESSME